MSGGSFNYQYRRFEDTYSGNMEDIELNRLIIDLAKLLKELKWYTSGDNCEAIYRVSVKEFKDKWLNNSDARVSSVKSLLAEKLTELAKEVQR